MKTPPNKALLASIRKLPCRKCGKRPPSQAAHIFTKGMGGGTRLDVVLNLVPLCLECHHSHHDGKEPTPGQLVEWVAERERMPSDTVLAILQGMLWRAPKEAKPCGNCRATGADQRGNGRVCLTCRGSGVLLNGEPWEG